MGILQSKLSDHQSSLDDAHKDKEEMETEMDQVKMAYERERTEIQRAHEDKVRMSSPFIVTYCSFLVGCSFNFENVDVNLQLKWICYFIHFRDKDLLEFVILFDTSKSS